MLLLKIGVRFFLFLGLFAIFVLFLTRFVFLIYASPMTFSLDIVPERKVAIVFGAGLLRDGSAGPVLSDRVETAVKLYQAGKVDKLLMSGDNRFVEYNEPEAMRQYALKAGVPDEDIVLDYAGRRTYDTCYRAYEIFKVKSAILVTQPFHMARALYLCNSFGVESVGVEADNRYFLKRSRLIWNTRELFAMMGAAWDVMFAHPLPVLGEPEPIF
ncbi:MAG: YdcF family protein [Anaerolineales bacterium]|nr:YdcF family protein [Anaerolineales bacterium]